MRYEIIAESWVSWYWSCFSAWFHQTVEHQFYLDHGLVAYCFLIMKLHPSDVLDSQIEWIWEDLPDFTLNGNGTCQYNHSYFISHELLYENGWYSMAMLDYWRLNHGAAVHTHQMLAPLRKWRGDKKISPSGMSSALAVPQNISRSRNDDLRWKCISIHSCSHNQIQQTNPSKKTFPSTPPET